MRLSTFYETGNFYKGNLHSHSTLSDGKHAPEVLCRMYREKGYDFLAITDHNVYGCDDSLCREDFITIPGIEVDWWEPGNPRVEHFLCIGIEGENSVPHGQRFLRSELPEDTTQEMVTYFASRGNMVFFAHPTGSGLTYDDVNRIDGLYGIEVFNTGCQVDWKLGVSESHYDHAFRAGRRAPDGSLYRCTAADDAHREKSDFFGGWVVVKAEALTRRAITHALRDGSFYASRGPDLYDFYIEDGRAYVKCSPCRDIHLLCDGKAAFSCSREADGSLLTSMELDLSGRDLPYLRAVCIDAEGYEAWSQPIALK